MAKAKRSSATSALVPISSGSLPDYGGRQSQYLAQQRASTPMTAGMPRIQAGQGFFLLPGQQQGVKTFDAVVLCALRVNRWHEAAYDPKNPLPPDCVAIARLGQHENSMAPNPTWPKVQSETCLPCKQNVRGGPKKCRNGIDLAIVSAEGDEIDWAKTTIWSHTISSTGIQPWGKTVQFLAEKRVPELFAAVFRFQSIAEQTWYVTVATPVAYTPAKVVDVLAERVKEAEGLLLANAEPFVVDAGAEEGEKPPMRKAKAPAAKGRTGRSLRN